MRIGVEVNDFFKRYGARTGKFDIELEPGSNVLHLFQKLNMPSEKVGFVVVNQKRVEWDYIFSENDDVYICPLATGG
jgi:molybdopterin converting factor small subunit